jgi:hypothetical protein
MPVTPQESEALAEALYKAVRQANKITNRMSVHDIDSPEKPTWSEVGQNDLKNKMQKQAGLSALAGQMIRGLGNYKASLGHGVQGIKQMGQNLLSSPKSVGSLYGRSVQKQWAKGNRFTAPFKGITSTIRSGLGADQARGIGAIKSLTTKGTALAGGVYVGNKLYKDKQDSLRNAYAGLGE